jgi:Flp pilus assembly protein TadD
MFVRADRLTATFTRLATVTVTSVLLAGCASSLPTSDFLSSAKPSDTKAEGKTDLAKATEYWAEQHKKNPKDAKSAIAYAKNLRAMGQKQQAAMVLQDVQLFNQSNFELNGELGRVALELDQLGAAEKYLAMADDPMKPDWRIISARGTVLAKQGRHGDAIPLFERAMGIAGDQPTVLNNLALAYAMDGQPEKAEELLRKALAGGATDPRITQNLALVLGLQGRHDDAKSVAQQLPGDTALQNVALVQELVKPQAPATIEPIPQNAAPLATASTAQAKPKKGKPEPKVVAAPKKAPAPVAQPEIKTTQADEDPAAMVRRLAEADAARRAQPGNTREGVFTMQPKR